MAIALDGGGPDCSAGGVAGQPRPGFFKRQRDRAASPASASSPLTPAPLAADRAAARPRGGAHRAHRVPALPSEGASPAGPAGAGASPERGCGRYLPAPGSAPLDSASDARARSGRPSAPGHRAASLGGLAVPRVARIDSMAGAGRGAGGAGGGADFDVRAVKESFAYLTANAPLAMEHFYAHLFISSPETRAMFPMEMSQMRERLFGALSRLVWSLDSAAESAAYLSRLGRDHRKYGVKDKHFEAFFTALLETVAHFCGSSWTPEIETAWLAALEYAARTMRSAAEADARDYPAWWVGEVVGHDRRTDTVAVLTIRPDKPLPYRAGQYVPVQVPRWPRVWRPYSIANAPRADGLIDLHVRAVPGGLVSADLVRHAAVGDTLLLGPASGEMTAPPPGSDRELICVAGGTGLAPVKAIVEAATGGRRGERLRRITLFVGARRMDDVYDLPSLQALQAANPGLQVILVLCDESVLSGRPLLTEQQAAAGLTAATGMLPGAVLEYGRFEQAETYICGPPAMVRQTAHLLAGHVPAAQVHHDPLPGGAAFAGWRAQQASPAVPEDFRHSPLYAKFTRPGFPPAPGLPPGPGLPGPDGPVPG